MARHLYCLVSGTTGFFFFFFAICILIRLFSSNYKIACDNNLVVETVNEGLIP